ncbi:hypothetical protein N7466_009696 [Penicillium verhagenii]|uniref:uncharacterized protein n=1 Tax=Penicillium verhagenii TaxID=1562060 RepID=UPI002544D561|nr:uncharacterized protein N7466_009696 [Penicillium verhagenii]KAJ5921370.1 hypothetical protein N7466_009696 [Penicillium verhagenii]
MAESLSADKNLTVPPYPDGLKQVKVEQLSEEELREFKSKLAAKDAHHAAAQPGHAANASNLAGMSLWHETQQTLYVRSGSFEFPGVTDFNNTIVHLYANSYHSTYRDNKNDNNSFNFWDAQGRIVLHISFRRHTQTIVFNDNFNGHWGYETVVDFPTCIEYQQEVDIQVWTGGSESIIVFGNEGGWRVDHGGAATALTYRSNDDGDAMFGDSIMSQFSWRLTWFTAEKRYQSHYTFSWK